MLTINGITCYLLILISTYLYRILGYLLTVFSILFVRNDRSVLIISNLYGIMVHHINIVRYLDTKSNREKIGSITLIRLPAVHSSQALQKPI